MTPGRKLWVITSAAAMSASTCREVVGVLEVGGERLLAAVGGVEDEAVAIDDTCSWSPANGRPHRVPGRSTLMTRGAHVGQPQPGPGSGHVLGELQDDQALEWSLHAAAASCDVAIHAG